MINFIIYLFKKKPPSATDKLFYMFANCKEIEAHYERLSGLTIITSEIGTLAYKQDGAIFCKDAMGYFIDSDNEVHSLKDRPSKSAEQAFMKAFEENIYGGILK
jgi:hypothetical protein